MLGSVCILLVGLIVGIIAGHILAYKAIALKIPDFWELLKKYTK